MSLPCESARAMDARSVDICRCGADSTQDPHTENLLFDLRRGDASRWRDCHSPRQRCYERYSRSHIHTLNHTEQLRLQLAPHECPSCRSRNIERTHGVRFYEQQLEVGRSCGECNKAWLETYTLNQRGPLA